jgi:hypothetical protein
VAAGEGVPEPPRPPRRSSSRPPAQPRDRDRVSRATVLQRGLAAAADNMDAAALRADTLAEQAAAHAAGETGPGEPGPAHEREAGRQVGRSEAFAEAARMLRLILEAIPSR